MIRSHGGDRWGGTGDSSRGSASRRLDEVTGDEFAQLRVGEGKAQPGKTMCGPTSTRAAKSFTAIIPDVTEYPTTECVTARP